MLFTFLLGLATGFSLSMPIGPINITVIREALHGHFRRAFSIGAGGVMADTFYCALAFLGFSQILDEVRFLWPYLEVAGGVIVIGIGFYYIVHPIQDSARGKIQTTEDPADHLKRAFPLGFLLGISNVSLFVLWGGVNTVFVSNGWIDVRFFSVLVCVIGIMLGSLTWFFTIAFCMTRFHHVIESALIKRITQTCGILLIVFGITIFSTMPFKK